MAPSVAWHVHRLHHGIVPALAQHHATADVVVTLVRDPAPISGDTGAGRFVVDATIRSIGVGGRRAVSVPVLLLARGAGWQELLPGQRLEVRARLNPPRSGDDVAAVLDTLAPPRLLGRPPWWQRAAGAARQALRRTCAGMPPDERGLLPGLVDGDTAAVPLRLRDDMRATGLSHLEAVSGENLGIVLAVVLTVLRGAGLRRRMRAAGAAVAVIGFVVLARPSPSVQRAAVMSGVTLVAMLSGRRAATRSALAAAVLLLVLLDPFLARSIGFVLSVVATAGIVVLAPAWMKRLERRLPRPLALALAVAAAAQLACTPVLLLSFGQLTPYAIPANLVAGPAVVPATVLGVLGAVVAPVSPACAWPIIWLGGLPTGFVARVAHVFAALPGAATTTSRPATIAVAVMAMVGLAWAARSAATVASREIL